MASPTSAPASAPTLMDRLEGAYRKLAERQSAKDTNIFKSDTSDGLPPPGDTRREIVNTLEHTYGPILMAVGFAAFFAGTDAAQEVILGFITSLNDGFMSKPNGVPLAQAVASKLISLFLLSAVQIFTFSLAFNTLRLVGETNRRAGKVLMIIPAMCILLVAMGFWGAMRSDEWPGWSLTSILAVAFVAVMMIGHFFTVALPVWKHGITVRTNRRWVRRVQNFFVVIALLLLVLSLATGFFMPIYSVAAGPIGVAAAFAITAATVLSILTVLSTLMPGRFPLITLILLLVIAMSSQTSAVVIGVISLGLWYYNRDRKHPIAWATFGALAILSFSYAWSFDRVKTCITLAGCNLISGVEVPEGRAPELASAIAEFETDLPLDQPLRIVAAQGGGLFAAHHTATFLAARADTDPAFARSIFAISGVSGGSVGAGVYWAVRKSDLCPPAPTTCNTDAVRQIMERDYLSPALAGLLFRDNVDNFLPVSALLTGIGQGPVDRGNILERALVRGTSKWQRSERPEAEETDLLDMPIANSFDAARGAPLLFMNATRVHNGERYVLSPLRSLKPLDERLELFIPDPNDPRHYTRFQTQDGYGLSVVNAMVISARFPVVTPPARVVQIQNRQHDARTTIQLVDGGYYDNSGIETALDLAMALRDAGVSRKIEIVQLKVNEDPDSIKDDSFGPRQQSMKGTFGAPLSGFFGAWRARISLSERRMSDSLKHRDRGANVFVCPVTLAAKGFNFTLSWYLAPNSFEEIAGQSTAYATAAANGTRFCELAGEK